MWGENSERFRVMEMIASSLETQEQSQEKPDSVPGDAGAVNSGVGSQGVAFGDLVIRPKAM